MALFIKSLVICLFLLAPFAKLLPQSDDYQSRLQEGIRLYKAELLNDAKRTFRTLEKDYPDSITVLRYLGLISAEQEMWGDVRDWFGKILDIQEDDPEAHYYIGISYRETGKFKAFVLRGRDWRRAERNFVYVIENIGSYKDIYYQYALLKKYWEDYDRAVELSEEQLEHEPDDKAFVGVHRFYESFLYNQPAKFHEWAQSRSGERNRFYLAESYRTRGEFGDAKAIYHDLDSDNLSMSRVPLYIALAKLKQQQEQPDSCQFFYERALATIQNDIDASLMFQDVKYILSDEEWSEYRSLKDAEAKRVFFQKIWVARDPTPASKANYRIIEHVRRVIQAEKLFYFDGVRSRVNNPDKLNFLSFPRVFELNDKFNDKGLVYIRHGEPDDRAFFVEADVPLNETWVYYPRGQLNTKMIFHFWQDNNMAGNNWRFIPSIPQFMAESRLNLDPIFGRLYTANRLEALAIDQEMKIQSNELVKLGMDTDQHSWRRSLRSIFFPFYISTFRHDETLSRGELYFSLSQRDVLPKDAPHTAEDSVSLSFAVFDLDYDVVQQNERFVQISEILDSSETLGYWPSSFEFVDAPGLYQLALDIQTPNDEAIGGYKFRFNMSSYAGDELKMSGLVVASSITPAQQQNMFYKNGLAVIPNPAKRFNRKEPIDIYFELYNVAEPGQNQNFQLRYSVTLLEERAKGIIQQIGKIFRRAQPSIANEIERETSTPTSVEYIALDLGKNVPGVYELSVSAFVPGKTDTVSRNINFELE